MATWTLPQILPFIVLGHLNRISEGPSALLDNCV